MSNLIDTYDTACSRLRTLGPKLESLINDLLEEGGVRVHSVRHRVKERASVERKIARTDQPYPSLDAVTDLLGARIITYFPDEVDHVAKIIEDEFDIDQNNSVDRRATLDPDRMGYLSLHYVARIGVGRRDWSEYRRFGDCVFEIQIRSILQHAWAEIEHDLGYKTERAIPRELRRRFSRLAGLLEVADQEFRSIRDDVAAYSDRVQEEVVSAPETTLIDQDSLVAFINSAAVVRETDEALAEIYGESIEDRGSSYTGRLAEHVQHVGIQTIADLEATFRGRRDLVLRFAQGLGEAKRPSSPMPSGVSLFQLTLILAAESGGKKGLAEYCRYLRFPDPDEGTELLWRVYNEALS